MKLLPQLPIDDASYASLERHAHKQGLSVVEYIQLLFRALAAIDNTEVEK